MNTDSKIKFHLFGFETPRYYCTIKAKSMRDAIEQFCICFGESALLSVHHIHNCYEESICNLSKKTE